MSPFVLGKFIPFAYLFAKLHANLSLCVLTYNMHLTYYYCALSAYLTKLKLRGFDFLNLWLCFNCMSSFGSKTLFDFQKHFVLLSTRLIIKVVKIKISIIYGQSTIVSLTILWYVEYDINYVIVRKITHDTKNTKFI